MAVIFAIGASNYSEMSFDMKIVTLSLSKGARGDHA